MTVIPLSVVVVAMVDGGAVKEAESVAHGGITIAAGADGRHWAGASQNGRSLPELSPTGGFLYPDGVAQRWAPLSRNCVQSLIVKFFTHLFAAHTLIHECIDEVHG